MTSFVFHGRFDSGRLSDEMVAAGLPLLTIRGNSGRIEVVLSADVPEEQVRAVVLAHDATPRVPEPTLSESGLILRDVVNGRRYRLNLVNGTAVWSELGPGKP